MASSGTQAGEFITYKLSADIAFGLYSVGRTMDRCTGRLGQRRRGAPPHSGRLGQRCRGAPPHSGRLGQQHRSAPPRAGRIGR